MLPNLVTNLVTLLCYLQAFKTFEHLARQDDARRQQEQEEKLKKREEGAAAASGTMKLPVVAEEVEISSVEEPNSASGGEKPSEPEKPLAGEVKAEVEVANVPAEPPPAAASGPVEAQPEEQSK